MLPRPQPPHLFASLRAGKKTRSLRISSRDTSLVVQLAPSAPAIQIFILTMRAFDRGQLIIESRWFVARCAGRSRNHETAPFVFAQPPNVGLARDHLLRRPDVDVAQRCRCQRFV